MKQVVEMILLISKLVHNKEGFVLFPYFFCCFFMNRDSKLDKNEDMLLAWIKDQPQHHMPLSFVLLSVFLFWGIQKGGVGHISLNS